MYWLTAYCISMPPLYWLFHKKMLFPIPFRMGHTRKAIAVNSLKRVKTCSVRTLPRIFVCVEVLRPSQPNGVMSSAVSLPNHTFTGQA